MVLAMKIAEEAGMVLEIQTKIEQLETQECVLYERPVKVGNYFLINIQKLHTSPLGEITFYTSSRIGLYFIFSSDLYRIFTNVSDLLTLGSHLTGS